MCARVLSIFISRCLTLNRDQCYLPYYLQPDRLGTAQPTPRALIPHGNMVPAPGVIGKEKSREAAYLFFCTVMIGAAGRVFGWVLTATFEFLIVH